MRATAAEARFEEVLARSEIRAVLARYVRGVDRLDEALIRGCYHSDAYEVHGMYNGNAHEFAAYRVQQTFRSHHVLSESSMTFDRDRAFVETPHSAIVHVDINTAEHAGIIENRSSGWYFDVFTRRNGVWLIQHRHVNTFARSQTLISAAEQPDPGLSARLSALQFDLAQATPEPSQVPDVADQIRRTFVERSRQSPSRD